jgi:hypothetical protein
MAAAQTDMFKKTGAGTVTTLAAPGKALSATSITVGATTNHPTDTGIVIAIRQVDSAGELVAGTYTEWSATVTSGTSFAINAVPVYGSDQVYAAGSTTQVYIPLSAYAHNELIDGILTEHNQDGTHSNITATTVTADEFIVNGATSEGWQTGVPTPDTVTYNGNRSYNLVFNSNDLTDTVSNGMRVKLARTVTPPTQCTDLESGSSQYASLASASVTGSTFTTAFTCMAWIEPESYTNGAIISRTDGTSGWFLELVSDGTVRVVGDAGASIDSGATYQSVVLNKWQHVAVTMDMVANTVLTYIDGVSVPNSAASATAALVQAGNLQVGARNGGTFFDGKIAQAAVFSSVLSASTIRSYASQGLSGSESTAVAVYPLNGDFNDLTSNNNDLVAQAGATATTVDSPFNATEYGIITANSFSTNTTLTVQVPVGYAIPTSGGVSSVFYSTQDVPYGFPVDENTSTTKIIPGNSRALYATNSSTVTKAGNSTSYTQISGSLYLTPGIWYLNGTVDVTWPASYDAEFKVVIYDQTNAANLSASNAAAVRNAVANAVGHYRGTSTIVTITTPRVVHLGVTSGGGSATTFSCLADGAKLIAVRVD